MAVIKTNLTCELQKAVQVQYLDGNLFSQDNQANEINVAVLDGGEPASISGTVTAKIIRADGVTVPATGGTISGNVASIALPAAAYVIPGVVSITVQLTASGVITTIAAVVTNIYKTSTDTVVDPGTIIPSITTLISQIETAVASIPADYSSLWTSLAPAFSTSATYAPGQYVTYDGTLYVCTTAHTGSWVAGHFAATNLGAGLSELKSAIDFNLGNENIPFTGIGYYIKTNQDVGETVNINSHTTDATFKNAVIDCQPGDIFSITGSAGSTPRLWAFVDSQNVMLEKAAYGATSALITAPANAAKLIVNSDASNSFIFKGKEIKKQISEITDDISTLINSNEILEEVVFDNEEVSVTVESDVYWNLEASVASKTSASNWRAAEVNVKPGEVYDVTAYKGQTNRTRLWAVTDNNYNIISMDRERAMTDYVKQTSTCLIPSGGTKLLLSYVYNTNIASPMFSLQKKNPAYASESEFESAVYRYTKHPIKNTYNKYWNVETSTAVLTQINAAFYASDPIPVIEGQTFTLTAQQGNTDKTRIWVVVDDSYNIIEMCENLKGTTTHTVTFTIPQGGKKLLLTKQASASTQELYRRETALDLVASPLTGRRLSLLGDSISAYAGTIPEGNDAYYTGNNSGVSSANQMWWKILCNKTGMIPLVINGWSGSGVTQLEDSSHVNKVPMSSDERCSALGDGTNTPDVILIAGGVNDYTYAESAQSEPLEWDGKTTPVLGNSFTEAYACMIKKIQNNYPNAIVVALSTWFTMRGTDNGYTLTHTVGSNVYTQQDYNDKIRYVAEQMHIPYIDVSNIGFNRNNFYPTYAEDSSTIPTHPNANGQYVMGSAIAEKLIDLVNGYFN